MTASNISERLVALTKEWTPPSSPSKDDPLVAMLATAFRRSHHFQKKRAEEIAKDVKHRLGKRWPQEWRLNFRDDPPKKGVAGALLAARMAGIDSLESADDGNSNGFFSRVSRSSGSARSRESIWECTISGDKFEMVDFDLAYVALTLAGFAIGFVGGQQYEKWKEKASKRDNPRRRHKRLALVFPATQSEVSERLSAEKRLDEQTAKILKDAADFAWTGSAAKYRDQISNLLAEKSAAGAGPQRLTMVVIEVPKGHSAFGPEVSALERGDALLELGARNARIIGVSEPLPEESFIGLGFFEMK